MSSARLRLKTRLLAVIVILANVFGNFFLSLGLKPRGAALGFSLPGYLEALANPWVSLGISILILWLLSRMALLSWADLSYVLPLTSCGYILTAVLGTTFMGERISWQRGAGTVLIALGVVLVGRTSIRTSRRALGRGLES